MLVDKTTPVQQLDGSLEAEDGVLHQHLLLPLRHVTLPLCMLGALGVLSPSKELHPFLQHKPEQVSSTGLSCHRNDCWYPVWYVKSYMAEQDCSRQHTKHHACKGIRADAPSTKQQANCLRQKAVSRSYMSSCGCELT